MNQGVNEKFQENSSREYRLIKRDQKKSWKGKKIRGSISLTPVPEIGVQKNQREFIEEIIEENYQVF